MSKLIFLFSFLMWLNMSSKNALLLDRTKLLTGTGKKSWYLYSSTPESAVETCKVSHAISLDNTYTFFSDGRFEFDHGSLTEDTSCTGNCCSDTKNMAGSWKFNFTEKNIKVTVLHKDEVTRETQKVILFDAAINQLDEDVLRISQTDSETGILYVIEYRKK